MIKERVVRSMSFWTSRVPKLFLGVFLIFSGLKHMFFAGSSFTGQFGFPLLIAGVVGLPLTWIGVSFSAKALWPRLFDSSYNLPSYPKAEDQVQEV